MLTCEQTRFLNDVCTGIWTEENDAISVKGNVTIYKKNLLEIPVQFKKINRYFSCRHNQLTTLKGCPIETTNFFSCSNNILTSLIGAPETCNNDFFCNRNLLTTLEGCPSVIENNFECNGNPDLHILYGLGWIKGKVKYDNYNDLNEWIITRAHTNIFSSYLDISEWIKRNRKLEFLLNAQPEIRQYFSPRILKDLEFGIWNF